MTQDLELSCRCGEVHGWVKGVSPGKINRAICYCDDCQAFAHHLGRADLLVEHIVGLRLSPKGLHRWYASCCKTPLGNTMTPALPFVGIVAAVLRGAAQEQQREQLFGKVRGAVLGRFAKGGAPPPGSTKPDLRMMAHVVRLLLGWKLSGKAWPHPFFDRTSGAPSRPVTVLTREERDALRPLCGPDPTSIAAS
jgi:hypothetical protein